jgi:hypothetical protein
MPKENAMNLPSLPADKANHALYGALIFILVGAVLTLIGQAAVARPAGVAAAVVVGLLKELLDWRANRAAVAAHMPPPHGVEKADLVATGGGALLCWLAAVATGG